MHNTIRWCLDSVGHLSKHEVVVLFKDVSIMIYWELQILELN